MRTTAKSAHLSLFSAAVVAASALTASSAWGQNIVQNGGFETTGGTNVGGLVAGWNVFNGPDTGPPPAVTEQFTVDTTHPHTGTNDLLFTNNNPNGFGLYAYQDTPAGSVTPGTTYTFNFYAAGQTSSGGVCIYDVRWGNANGIISDTGGQVFFPNSLTYAQYPAANNTYQAPAGATYAELAFTAATGAVAGSVSQLYLDDVSFTGPGTTNGGSGATAWAVAGAGDWNVATNWTNGVPNGVGAEADLFSALTANHTVFTDTPIVLGTLNFNNANTYVVTGAGSLTMQAASGSASIIVQAGTQKINLPLTFAGASTINVSTGATLLISDPTVINAGVAVSTVGTGTVTYQSTVTINAGGSLTLGGPTVAHSLALLGNASVTTSTHRSLYQVDVLSMSVASHFDLANNDLVVHGGSLASVTSSVATGFNGGQWNGAGISSSVAAASTTHLMALGVIQAGATGTFDGKPVAAGDVLVRYTYYGDANLDGKVDGSDYSKIDNGFAQHASDWANGDFNYDGVVDGSDYTLIDNGYNRQGSPVTAGSADLLASPAAIPAAVPEPAALGVLAAAVIGLRRRR